MAFIDVIEDAEADGAVVDMYSRARGDRTGPEFDALTVGRPIEAS